MCLGYRTRSPERFGNGYRGVVLRPKAFSCLNLGDPNRIQILHLGLSSKPNLDAFRECQYAVLGVIDKHISDNTGGANHYYSTALTTAPYWSKDMRITRTIGDHVFLKDR